MRAALDALGGPAAADARAGARRRAALPPRGDLERLLAAAAEPAGALLAVPVRDTLKQADADGRVAATVARDGLWQALTPQGFPLAALATAMAAAAGDAAVTDEAAAMEGAGHGPRLIEGDPSNIKITRPGDLPLAAAILGHRTPARSA
ncbi:MAG: 2-C-methyl-D-erythritol 4-phosphate cytidylyltransferase [Halofilum sp. (in: g-proteobacteria)]|nr:2-C-methyl-D-erythritol 4-phosphate cytidylyltransferase [Halofilum sp. (in: g-proteobacteria)]